MRSFIAAAAVLVAAPAFAADTVDVVGSWSCNAGSFRTVMLEFGADDAATVGMHADKEGFLEMDTTATGTYAVDGETIAIAFAAVDIDKMVVNGASASDEQQAQVVAGMKAQGASFDIVRASPEMIRVRNSKGEEWDCSKQ